MPVGTGALARFVANDFRASDGNLAAAVGCPTLDGLGPDGGGAHSTDEHVLLDDLPRRAALFAALLARL